MKLKPLLTVAFFNALIYGGFKMTYFNNINDLQELKKAFIKWCKKLHPDNGGDSEAFKEMQNEYSKLYKHFEMFGNTSNMDRENADNSFNSSFDNSMFSDIVSQLAGLDGLIIELVGSWLWVSGNTYPHKEVLKELKFRWSSKKQAWYFHFEPYKKKSKKSFSLDDIKNMYGSTTIKGTARAALT
jgi:DnaJ-class molecular chaperone